MTKRMTLCTHLISARQIIHDASRTATGRMGAKRSWIGHLVVDWSATFPRKCNAHREKNERKESFAEEENHLHL